MKIREISPQEIIGHELFCIKDIKSRGFKAKRAWYGKEYQKGLRIALAEDGDYALGFIEYTEIDNAWRPVQGENMLFIHCMMVYPNRNRSKGVATALIQHVKEDAINRGRSGIATFSSKGAWISNDEVFLKNGFVKSDDLERFELLQLSLNGDEGSAKFIDWTAKRKSLKGWHLIYANQCPWHQKGVEALMNTAEKWDIDLSVSVIEDSLDAQSAPGGFGVFSLVHDGKELADHYISKTRFENILKKELA